MDVPTPQPYKPNATGFGTVVLLLSTKPPAFTTMRFSTEPHDPPSSSPPYSNLCSDELKKPSPFSRACVISTHDGAILVVQFPSIISSSHTVNVPSGAFRATKASDTAGPYGPGSAPSAVPTGIRFASKRSNDTRALPNKYTPPQSPFVVEADPAPASDRITTGFASVPLTSKRAFGKMTIDGFMDTPPGLLAPHAYASSPPQSPRT
mmetsp:Transcript_2400/g.9264  ORF Transcript_2400/g.9264 Transcript_2400/m.9264 type:complete len:207 (-) Transcript_2400:536-1156(-)